jgi:hypothetical protein
MVKALVTRIPIRTPGRFLRSSDVVPGLIQGTCNVRPAIQQNSLTGSKVINPAGERRLLTRNHIDHHLKTSKPRRHSNDSYYLCPHIIPYQPDDAPNSSMPTYSTLGQTRQNLTVLVEQ